MIDDFQVRERLQQLEQALLNPSIRGDPSAVADFLDEDFREFGASGTVYDRASMLQALADDPGFDGTRTISGFSAIRLAENIALVTYRIAETGTLRSSIWRDSGSGWKLVFHQGTLGG